MRQIADTAPNTEFLLVSHAAPLLNVAVSETVNQALATDIRSASVDNGRSSQTS